MRNGILLTDNKRGDQVVKDVISDLKWSLHYNTVYCFKINVIWDSKQWTGLCHLGFRLPSYLCFGLKVYLVIFMYVTTFLSLISETVGDNWGYRVPLFQTWMHHQIIAFCYTNDQDKSYVSKFFHVCPKLYNKTQDMWSFSQVVIILFKNLCKCL